MNDIANLNPPLALAAIQKATLAVSFGMASDLLTGSLLRTLAASKPGGAFLELGTGTGLATAWLLDGLDAAATLITVDQDAAMQAIAQQYLGHDPRLTFYAMDGAQFILNQQAAGTRFDFIFADTWPGKYTEFEETLGLLKQGGFYLIDDMLTHPNWPAEHAPKVAALLTTLQQRKDLYVTQLNWASGLLLATKISE